MLLEEQDASPTDNSGRRHRSHAAVLVLAQLQFNIPQDRILKEPTCQAKGRVLKLRRKDTASHSIHINQDKREIIGFSMAMRKWLVSDKIKNLVMDPTTYRL